MIKKIISIINIILPIILFILLEVFTIPDKFVNIMTLTLVIGWLIPYFVLLLSGIGMLLSSHYKLIFIMNLLNILLSSIVLFLISKIYTSAFLLELITYILFIIMSVINLIYIHKNKYEEYKKGTK
jgi:hypothetical protein